MPARFIANLAKGTQQKIVLYGTSLTANGAWVSQLQAATAQYPGTATWVNSGGSGKASDWGVANLQTKVLRHHPDAVFIEFSMNDAATKLNISRHQARTNLDTMVDAIRAARPDCEIILQIMNPVDRQPGDTLSPRPDLELYQQDCRDYAAAEKLLCIDHMPAWQALLDKGTATYRAHVPDGVHPSANGLSLFMTPVLLHALGIPQGGAPVVRLRMDNRRMAEAASPGAPARASSLIVWLPEAAAAPITVLFDTAGSTAAAGTDYAPPPASLTIPAGQLSASFEVVPLHDGVEEPEEIFRIKVLPDAAYKLSSPIEAAAVIEASTQPPP